MSKKKQMWKLMEGNEKSKFSCIDGFGEELEEIIYEGASNWFISFRSVFTVYSAHFSYLLIFFAILACGVLSYRHSVENGTKYTHFWWGALIHGVVSECRITATGYWHAQAPIMFFGKQLPLHIVVLYPSIIYIAMMSVHRLKLNICTEPAAVGLVAALMELPFRMVSVKFLHITYHDTEPLYYHKLCGVPWVEVYSSLIMASSYVTVYHGMKFYLSRNLCSIWDNNEINKKEHIFTFGSGLISPIVGFIQKVILFHILYDLFNINPISCLLFTASLYLCFILCFEPRRADKCLREDTTGKGYLLYQISVFLLCLLFLSLFGNPQNEVSIGTHEPTGDCTTIVHSKTPLGKPVKRKKYLCAEEINGRRNFVYNFDCLEDGPPYLNSYWYTICGSPIHNRPQFVVNISSFAIFLWCLFLKILLLDLKKMEVAKKLIVRFQQVEATNIPIKSREQVAVGFVLVKPESLPKGFKKVPQTES